MVSKRGTEIRLATPAKINETPVVPRLPTYLISMQTMVIKLAGISIKAKKKAFRKTSPAKDPAFRNNA